MSVLDCEVCFYAMDKNKFLPRILPCGHTFCNQCVSNLIDSSKLCPTCSRPFTNDNINDYPVNYIVLKLKYSAKELETSSDKVLEKYKKKLHMLKSEHEDLKSTLTTLTELFDGSGEQLDTLIEASETLERPCESKEEVKKLEEVLENFRRQISPIAPPSTESASFPLEDRKPDFDIVAEIRNGIADRRTVAAVMVVNGVKMFSRISLMENFLFAHSFVSRQEFDEDEDEVITFCFNDLQDCIFKMNPDQSIYGFLDLSCQTKSSSNRVIIEIRKSSMDLGSSFLKLCTGERGISFKRNNYSQKYKSTDAALACSTYNDHHTSADMDKIIQVKKIGGDVKDVSNESSYSKFLNRNRALGECEFDSYYLSFKEDGSFEIFKLYNAVTKHTCQSCSNTTTTQYRCQICSVISNQLFCQSCRVTITQHYCQCCGSVNSDASNGKDRKFMDVTGQIITVKDTTYQMSNVVGRILDSEGKFESTFKDVTFGKILDCGIAFKL